jgi:hypothetical protein
VTDSEPRPEAINALFSALCTMDPAKLARASEGIAPLERQRAEELFKESLLVSQDHRARTMEAWQLLTERQWPSSPTWEQIFDQLTPEAAARLRDLYDALPDGARPEWDRRYGAPEGDL